MSRFVGIDPSSATGLVILDQYGQVVHESEIKIKHRIDPLRMVEICRSIKKHVRASDQVAIENFSFGSRGRGISFQFGLGWVIRTMLFLEGLSFIEVPPTQVKKFASGKGNAKKEALIEPVKTKWGYEHKSDNVIDAYIIARICRALYVPENLLPYEDAVIKDLKKNNDIY